MTVSIRTSAGGTAGRTAGSTGAVKAAAALLKALIIIHMPWVITADHTATMR